MVKNRIIPSYLVQQQTSHSEKTTTLETFQHSAEQSDETLSNNNEKRFPFFKSIRCCIMFLLSVVVVSSVLILSAIWMASLLPNLVNLTIQERETDFKNIISSITDTVVDVTFSLDMMKGQLLYLLDFQNAKQIEQVTYQSYLSEWKRRNGFVVTVYIGDNIGNAVGIYNSGPDLNWLNMSLEAQTLYKCDPDLETYPFCKRNSQPTSIMDPVDLSPCTDACRANPNKFIFSKSNVDVTTINTDTFFTLLYCYSFNESVNNQFDYYLGFDITVASASEILIEKMSSIPGARSFVFETENNFFVAGK